ncbi:MAG: hypothetical protein AAFR38_09005 [Planctomycetota bacterium]
MIADIVQIVMIGLGAALPLGLAKDFLASRVKAPAAEQARPAVAHARA